MNLLLHGVTFAKYKWNQQNVGALGYSKYTDKNPLIIPVCKVQYGNKLVACFNLPRQRSLSRNSSPLYSALSSPSSVFQTARSRQTSRRTTHSKTKSKRRSATARRTGASRGARKIKTVI